MKTRFWHRCALSGAALFFCFCSFAYAARFADPAEDVARVYEIVDARLALMMDVAAWKWVHGEQIVDAGRERIVIDGTVTKARDLGFDAQSIQRAMEVQLELARAVQTAHFESWREHGFPPNQVARDLQTDLRPALDAIGDEFLAALFWASGQFQSVGNTESVGRALRRIASYPGVTAQDLSRLRRVLQDVRGDHAVTVSMDRLHVIRVGTTGDYAPFSLESNGELRGSDIELAEALAAHLKLQPRFVRTTWPSLMSDLEAGGFDIAVSGIANTPERAARAEFSTAYHFDGKTPIARCQDRTRFGSLNDIDRETVRVIVNEGGTNQQFVREHLSRAKIIVHPDNRTVFDEIVAGRADVMITDAIEVELQTRSHKELCRTMSNTLTNTAKAIMLPRGSALTQPIDQWLQAEVARGGVQEKLQHALSMEE